MFKHQIQFNISKGTENIDNEGGMLTGGSLVLTNCFSGADQFNGLK